MPDVFVSHSHKDKEVADKLVRDLRQEGISVWYDDDDLLVGHDIVDEVYDGIRNSRFLAVVLTTNSVQSKWVRQEINRAKVDELERSRVILLPLLFEDCPVPDPLVTKKYADFRTDYLRGFRQLLTRIQKRTFPRGMADRKMDLEDLLRAQEEAIRELLGRILHLDQIDDRKFVFTRDFSDANIAILFEKIKQCLSLLDHLVSIENSPRLLIEYYELAINFTGIILDYSREAQYMDRLMGLTTPSVDAWICKGISNANCGQRRRAVESLRTGLRLYLEQISEPDLDSLVKFLFRVTRHVALGFAKNPVLRDVIIFRDKPKVVGRLDKTMDCVDEVLERERLLDRRDGSANLSYGKMLAYVGLTKRALLYLDEAQRQDCSDEEVGAKEIADMREQIKRRENTEGETELHVDLIQGMNFDLQFGGQNYTVFEDLAREHCPEFWREVIEDDALFVGAVGGGERKHDPGGRAGRKKQ